MKKTFVFISAVLCLSLLLTSCSGFNYFMRRDLGNIKNYREYECTYRGTEKTDRDLQIAVSFSESPNDNLKYYYYFSEEYQTRVVFLDIIEGNEKVLEDNGFFNEVRANNEITIKASPYIYMDTAFFYIIAIRTEDKVYLDEQIGLENMIKMMNENKSLL